MPPQTHVAVLVVPPTFSISAPHSVSWDEALKVYEGGEAPPMPRHCGFKRPYKTDMENGGVAEHSSPALPSFTEAQCDDRCFPAARARGLQNHRLIMTATPPWQLVLLWEGVEGRVRQGRSHILWNIPINQTIKERAARHLQTTEPQLIYDHDRKMGRSPVILLF